MKCQKCNEHLSDDTVFCFKCGTAVSEPIILCSGKKKDGTPCSSRLQEGYNFCTKCGSPVNQRKQTLCKGVMKDGSACSNLLEEETEFCSKCGTCQGAKPPVHQRTQTPCKGVMKDGSACGNLREEEAEFCLNCVTVQGAKPLEEISMCARSDAENGLDNINVRQDSALKFPVSSSSRLNEEIVEPSLFPIHPLPQSRSTSESVTKNSLDGESQDLKRNVSSDDVSVSNDTEDLESKMNVVTLSDASGHDPEIITADTGDKNTGDSEGDANTSDDSWSTESVLMLDKKTTKVKSQKKPMFSFFKNKKMQGRKEAAVRTNDNNLKQITKKFKALWKKKKKSKRKQGKKKTLDISNPCCLESLKDIQESPQKLLEKIDEKTANNSQPADTLEKGSIDHIHAVKEKVTIQETGNEINSDKDKSENTENGHAVDDERTENQGKEIAPIQETRNGINSGIMDKSENTGNGQVLSGKITGASALETQSNTSVKEQVKESMEPEVENLKSEKETGRGSKQNSKNLNMQQKNKDDVACGKRPAKSFVQRKIEDVRVHFHALLSPVFELSHGDQVLIQFGNEELGASLSDKHVAELIRRSDYQYIELKLELDIPRSLFTKDSKIEYSYAVVKDEKYMWEHYHSNGYGKRTLYLQDKDEWHQYDGVVNPKQGEGIFAKVKNVFSTDTKKSDERDLVHSVEYFLPKFFQDLYSGQLPAESVDKAFIQLEELLSSLRRVYFIDKGCFRDQADYGRKISDVILAKVLKSFEGMPLCDWKESPQESEIRMLQASTIVFALQYLQYLNLELSQEEMELLANGLLVRPNNGTRKCHDVDCIDKYFLRGTKQQLSDFLISFIDRMVKGETNSMMILCVPLHHFLTGILQPFDKVPDDVSHGNRNLDWWGTKYLNNAVQTIKKGPASKWPIKIEEFVSVLYPLFELDYFLPRTFMAMLSLTEVEEVIKTGKIPLEVCAATLSHYVLVTRPREQISYITKEEEMVGAAIYALGDMFKTVQAQEERCGTLVNQPKLLYKIAGDLLYVTLGSDLAFLVGRAAQTFLHAVAFYDLMQDQKSTSGTDNWHQLEHVSLLDKLYTSVRMWLNKYIIKWNEQLEKNLKEWDMIFAPAQLLSENVKQAWNSQAEEDLYHILTKKMQNYPYLTKALIQIYCKEVDSFHPSVQKCLSQMAFKAIETEYSVQMQQFRENERARFMELLSSLFERGWSTAVKMEDKQDMEKERFILEHTLTWMPFSHFLKIFSDEKYHLSLTLICQEDLKQAVSVIRKQVYALNDGTVTLRDLDVIKKSEDKFQELTFILFEKSEEKWKTFNVVKAVKIRQMEADSYQTQKKYVATLLQRCKPLNFAELMEVERIIGHLEKKKDLCIKDICQPADVETVTPEQFLPQSTAFKLAAEVANVLEPLHAWSRSNIFRTLWQDRHATVTVESFEEVCSQIWRPVSISMRDIIHRITSGEINFLEMKNLLGKIDGYEKMREEMTLINVPEEQAKERVGQLRQFQQMEAFIKWAETILDVARSYKLTGDFKEIEAIASKESASDKMMKDFDDSCVTSEFVKDLTPEKTECLEQFVKCKPLVLWLRESMTGGLKELKVFVDLASISAGEGDMEVAKVRCLHAATTGFAPLIFNLDGSSGYKELLDKCQIVWKELEADLYLPQKLQDTSRCLEWLKRVKQAHGSVEVTSLAQAEAINSKGVYCVGALNTIRDTFLGLDLHNTLHLTVPISDKESGDDREYTFEQLHDLQSRLMLVAGKAEQGKEDVNRFMMILDGVIRIANTFIKLNSVGCILFKNWQMKFLCNPNNHLCVEIEFGEGAVPLKGMQTKTEDRTEDVTEFLHKLARFTEHCLDEWIDHIHQKRWKYFELNYFTIDQLVILQQELLKVGSELGPDNSLYPLLSAVKENCTYKDLVDAMQKASSDMEKVEIKDDEECKEKKVHNVEVDKRKEEKVKNFIEGMIKAGFEESLAIEAVKHVDIDNIKKGILWCMGHMDETKTIEGENEDELGDLRVMAYAGWKKFDQSISTLTVKVIKEHEVSQRALDVDSLIKILTILWEVFLTSVSSGVTDCLSVEHLGLILKRLAEKDGRQIKRPFPQSFVQGQPNMIICPKADVLSTVLSVYMMGTSQPLPQADEVLMCTLQTTLDQLCVFWRRTIMDTSSKIHCLVNSDLLDFEVSDKGERELEKYIHQNKQNDLQYRLVVICSAENEYKSPIIAALDKFRRPPLPIPDIHDIADYVKRKLQVKEGNTAAAVDFDNSCVRVVKSWRAGVGKSLYVRRMNAKLANKNSHQKVEDLVTIPLQEKEIDVSLVIQNLLSCMLPPGATKVRIIHLDIAHEVQGGVDFFLFNLLILGCLTHKSGHVWRCSPGDLYLVEIMPVVEKMTARMGDTTRYVHHVFDFLPYLTCRSPQESLDILTDKPKPKDFKEEDQLFDEMVFAGSIFQRPYQYLSRFIRGEELNKFDATVTYGTPADCLNILLSHCGVLDPSWAELHHFVLFFDTQLRDFEESTFCSTAVSEDLPDFPKFVLRFLIQMSRDFSTRSLEMKEESPTTTVESDQKAEEKEETKDENGEEIPPQYQMRRTWERSPHPYLFFNPDGHTITFLGFNIQRRTGDLIDQQTRKVLEKAIMSRNLYDGLHSNRVPIQEDFDSLSRDKKIERLCLVMGNDLPHDPDDTYELTTDNVKKILAIYMRFKCDIPVIIMGETGCGKTRLVKFLCALQTPPGADVKSMILMKVHGGTTTTDIKRKVEEAKGIAQENSVYTVLFFDEANTTEAIGMIKEIMCDRSIEGKPLDRCEKLRFVAACNPYRKHSQTLIKRLEQAGLGYHVDADKTTDRLGRVPMRRLVYRVQPLPQSLLPLVWDFGQLNTQTEELYIRQMVKRYVRNTQLPNKPGLIEVVSRILTESQEFMRNQKDECSFVSLRDVERVMNVMSWFYAQSQNGSTLFEEINKKIQPYPVEKWIIEKEGDKDEENEWIAKVMETPEDELSESETFNLFGYNSVHQTMADATEEPFYPQLEEEQVYYRRTEHVQKTVIENSEEPQVDRFSLYHKTLTKEEERSYFVEHMGRAVVSEAQENEIPERETFNLSGYHPSHEKIMSGTAEELLDRQVEEEDEYFGRIEHGQNVIETCQGAQTYWSSLDHEEEEMPYVFGDHINIEEEKNEGNEGIEVKMMLHSEDQVQKTFYDQTERYIVSAENDENEDIFEVQTGDPQMNQNLNDITRSLVLALGVCYHACLKNREEYRRHMAKFFGAPCHLPYGANQIEQEISVCQDVFLENVQLEKNIACNMALKENVFMMVICTELRIPLFLVGKPGSSKSLAKTIVADAMQGNAAHNKFFREFKQVQMVSFQCSPLSTPDGIVGTFRQCAQFQKDKDLKRFVSVVVLDEVGLAEDSPRMPLKTLHPLLEDGCQGDEKPEQYKKVAFIGISNWALDPAKINRGILVQREIPDIKELMNTAEGICSGKDHLKKQVKPFIEPLANSYLDLFKEASEKLREFFGLRDFYSLMKMIYSFVEQTDIAPAWCQLQHSIKRNFGGLDNIDPIQIFSRRLTMVDKSAEHRDGDPDCSTKGLILACLSDTNNTKSESRYLLLLTENYGALSILPQLIPTTNITTIFGSSFPKDQEYTQICRNINLIKVCMETDRTVVLLNLENLYESLYDALNQRHKEGSNFSCFASGSLTPLFDAFAFDLGFTRVKALVSSLDSTTCGQVIYQLLVVNTPSVRYYVYFGGERYVDLGLGTHRVKCRVHKNFRLIVVAEKDVVYKKFPIPLINRLEKHFLTVNTILTRHQSYLADELKKWAEKFSSETDTAINMQCHKKDRSKSIQSVAEVFMGYHADTCSSIILHIFKKHGEQIAQFSKEEILNEAKNLLLWCATPDAVVRLDSCGLQAEERMILTTVYMKEQCHESFAQYLEFKLRKEQTQELFAQITTHSKLLSSTDKSDIHRSVGIPPGRIALESLQSFDTEQQFSSKIRSVLQSDLQEDKLLVIQCDSGNTKANLVACARYCIEAEYQHIKDIKEIKDKRKAPCHVIFIIQLPRIAGGCFSGFQCGLWHSAHIDDLRAQDERIPPIMEMLGKSVGSMMERAIKTKSKADVRQIFKANSVDRNDMESKSPDTEFPRQSKSEGRETNNPSGESGHDQGHEIIYERVDNKLDVDSLILSCVQSALAMVKDKETTDRSTQRIEHMLHLLHEKPIEGLPSFVQGLIIHIAALLNEKENKHSYRPENWLSLEAAKAENINKAGTFRRACIQHFESKIAPILAGIIAHIDTNHNMDIIREHISSGNWIARFWLQIINTQGAIQLQYHDLFPAEQKELNEVIVKTTGCEGQIFAAKIPFSWLIFEQIDSIWRTTQESPEETGKSEKMVDILKETKLGQLLKNLEGNVSTEEVVSMYAEDVIYMVYYAQTPIEHKIVYSCVKDMSDFLLKDIESSILARFVQVHECYNRIIQDLQYFHSINQVWPECSETVDKMEKENSDQFMLGILGLCTMIQDLCPPDEDYLNDAGKQQEWFQKICNFRPVIKKGLTLYSSATESEAFTKAKQQWTMITVMKLYIEHVVASDKDAENYGLKTIMPLWMLLEDSSDFKNVEALETLENFLKLRNIAAIKYFLGLLQTCSVCKKKIESIPVMLPCKDTICSVCFNNVMPKDSGIKICPKCNKNIPDTFNPDALRERKSVQKFREYQSRCNSFFMDVVSQLCFADNTAPSDDVVNRLLGYITMTATQGKEIKLKTIHLTKELTIFYDCVDPNPVFRSFLLQLLLRTSEKEVHNNLEKYFRKAKVVIGPDNKDRESHIVQLSQLVVQCLEDSLYMDCTEDNEINLGATYLTDAEQLIKNGPNMVERLYAIAKARVGLAIAAKHIHETVVKQGHVVTPQEQELIGKAASLCEGDCKWPKIFLIKYLCRCYGVDSYEAICTKTDVEYLKWIKYQESAGNVREVLDRYIVCGPHYTDIRETITKVVLGEDINQLDKAIQDMKFPKERKEILLCLALHREITMSILRDAVKNKVTPKAIEILKEYCSKAKFIENKETVQKILENDYEVQSHLLTVTQHLDLKRQGVLCLLMHCDLVLRNLHGERTLVQPLIRLATQPQTMRDAFLPTMPQDDAQEIRKAIQQGIHDNSQFYRCPNGHLYVIGECGRPVTEGKCHACGAAIGGQNYHLNEGNSLDQGGVDGTEIGHILGRAENRTQIGPERSLTPAYCGIIRLLTHLTMILGANIDSMAVSQFIHPTITDDKVSHFLWEHVKHDIDDLHRTLGKSLDDVLMLMHCILYVMMEKHAENEMNMDEICGLTTVKARDDWEKSFSEKYVAPTLQNMENVLKEFNQQLAEDKRLGSDPLPCIVYEKAIPQENINYEMPQEIASMWRYRSRITMDHLHHEFEVQMKSFEGQLKVLQLFLKEEHHLRAIRYIPSILRLHRILIQKYQWKLDRADASTITVNMLKELNGGELKRLLDEYAEVWELVKEDLVHVPEKYRICRIDGSTPVSQLLPTSADEGQCAYHVLEFLFRKQNDFLDDYYKEVKKSIKDIPHVKVRDITPAHLISYHPEQDILPLVLANCNYSFEVGKETTIEYNFTNLERQIIDRFLFGKSWIDIEITLMVYRAEYTNVAVFRKLQERIPQESLSSGVRHKISQEFHSLPDLCQALNNLDIAISFLKSIGGNPENSLDKFMVETLKMDQPLLSPKAQQVCQYRHTKSLWLLLSLEKTKMIAFHNQVIFDGVPEQFHEQLTAVLQRQMMNFLQPMSIERHDILIELMFECIILVISDPQNPDAEDYVDTKDNKFKDYLQAIKMEKDLDVRLDTFPDGVLLKFCVATWALTYQCLLAKTKQK